MCSTAKAPIRVNLTFSPFMLHQQPVIGKVFNEKLKHAALGIEQHLLEEKNLFWNLKKKSFFQWVWYVATIWLSIFHETGAEGIKLNPSLRKNVTIFYHNLIKISSVNFSLSIHWTPKHSVQGLVFFSWPKEKLPLFRCASISCFQVVSNWVSE